MKTYFRILIVILLIACCGIQTLAQARKTAAVGSATAKGGFRNEDEIRDKFNNWRTDEDAGVWLRAMNYAPAEIQAVTARKPHGEKADVEVSVKTAAGTKIEGISIKLVSTEQGFNQIDKRWLANYARMWKMPPAVVRALSLFTGETAPTRAGRAANRMFLNELDAQDRKAVVDFFAANKERLVSDLFAGDGQHSAQWIMVAVKGGGNTKWTLRSIRDAIRYFGDGDVGITRGGNLRIGRITMQRKGGDAGRETAKMLQFKINPVQLFALK